MADPVNTNEQLSSKVPPNSWDHPALRAFVEMLDRLAAPFAPKAPGGRAGGLLMVSHAEVHPHSNKDDVWVNIRLNPGDVEHIFAEARQSEARTDVNVYFGWHVLRPDLPARVRGGSDDVIAKLALVADFDTGPGHEKEANNFDPETMTIPGLEIAPAAVVETSPGNYQAIFAFSPPLTPAEATELGEMLWKVARCDPATKVLAQPWRPAGCINYPNHKKVKDGRAPVLTRWAKPWDGSTTTHADMRGALDVALEGQEDDNEPEVGAEGPDIYAEKSLAERLTKIRDAKDKSFKNALVFNVGKRLGRFIVAGRLDEQRVVHEVHEAIATWGDPSEPARKAGGTLARGIAAGKAAGPVLKATRGGALAGTSDDEFAANFVDKYGERLRYATPFKSWYTWTGVYWAHDKTNKVLDRIRQTNAERAAALTNSKSIRKDLRSVKKAQATETFSKADQRVAVEPSIFDADPWLLGTPGGTVDLRTGQLRPAKQEDYITRITRITPADVADETTCPRWLRFLNEVANNDVKVICYLQQWAGYSLTGVTTEQCFVFIFGPGGNGKGTWVHMLQYVMKDYAHEAAVDMFIDSPADKHPTSLAALNGVRAAFASETNENRTWNSALVRRLTGGDPITAHFMRQDDFTFIPVCKLSVISNHQPNLSSVNDADRRRHNHIPFTFQPSTVDRSHEAVVATGDSGA